MGSWPAKALIDLMHLAIISSYRDLLATQPYIRTIMITFEESLRSNIKIIHFFFLNTN